MAESEGGHPHSYFCVFVREHHWELLECVYHADSGGVVDCLAGVAMSAVPDAHPALRQRADFFVDVVARKMPEVCAADFADVSAD